MPPEEVLIIGAGLAGLTAAVHLAERGVPVRVLEADARYAGGRLWGGKPSGGAGGETITLNGLTHTFYPEHGMHGLWNNYVNLRAMLERFKIAPEVMLTEEEAWIHGEGDRVLRAEVGSAIHHSLVPPPFHYFNMFTRGSFLRMLGLRDWAALFAVWRSLLLALALDPFAQHLALRDEPLEVFLRGWSPRLRALFVGLARSGLAIEAEHITMASFIACLRFYTLLQRQALRFVYFFTDCGTALIQPLVETLAAREGELLLGLTATRLALGASNTWRVSADTPRGPRAFHASHVILAVDAPAAQRLLCESPATAPLAANLRWPAGLPDGIVRLWFKAQPKPGPEGGIFTGDFSVDNFFWLQRIRPEYGAWAKATGGSLLEMHVYRAPQILAQPDALILARAITDIYRAFPELRGQVIHQTFQRNAATQTRLLIDKPEHWLGVQTPWPNLWACGDWVRGAWPALNMERATVSGIEAANGVLRALGLEEFPLEAYPEPEWLAGKIQSGLLGGRAWLRRWLQRR